MAKITEKEMKTILQNEIPLDLEIDSGIFEFHECENVSIGVSYEHVGLGTHCVGYIFNLFVNGEYINIPSSYNNICEASSKEPPSRKEEGRKRVAFRPLFFVPYFGAVGVSVFFILSLISEVF